MYVVRSSIIIILSERRDETDIRIDDNSRRNSNNVGPVLVVNVDPVLIQHWHKSRNSAGL